MQGVNESVIYDDHKKKIFTRMIRKQLHIYKDAAIIIYKTKPSQLYPKTLSLPVEYLTKLHE